MKNMLISFQTDVNLRKIFPNPREKVEQMLAPLVKVYGENAGQRLEFEHTKYAGVWRCKLGLDWPRKFTVTATAADPNDAEECCYLQACSMLQVIILSLVVMLTICCQV